MSPEAIAHDYVAIPEHFDVHDAVLVGHSTGGYPAQIPLIRSGVMQRIARTDLLGEITVPTVVICGEQDSTTPRWQAPETLVAAVTELAST